MHFVSGHFDGCGNHGNCYRQGTDFYCCCQPGMLIDPLMSNGLFHTYSMDESFHHIRVWLIGCLGFNGPLRQYFSLYRAVFQRGGGKRRETIEENKNVLTTPTRIYCKRNRPLPYYHPFCRTPRLWKFTQDHRTTIPPLHIGGVWLDHLLVVWQLLKFLCKQ